MKKSLLICILAVLMCACVLFAACSPSLEADTLNSMKELLYQMYKDSNPSTTYKVVGLVASNGQKANIKWTVNVTEGSAEDVKVGELVDGEQTIEVNPYPTTDVKYTLTATITNEKGKAYEIDGAPVSISFERSLAEFVVNTYDEYLAACKANDGTTTIRIKAYIVGVVCMSSSSKGSMYLQDADGHGYYAYAPTGVTEGCTTDADLRAKWPVGTEVYVNGTVTTYNGQYEYNKNCEILATGKTAEQAGVTLAYTDATTAFAAATSNEDNALDAYQNARVTLKDAIITRISESGTKGTSDYKAYYYFTLPNSEVEFNVYYTIYFIDEATTTAVCDKLQVGKKVDLTGIVSVYSKDFQIYPDSATSVSNVRDVVYTDEEKVAIAKKNLTIATGVAEPSEIALPAAGALDTTITWAFAAGKTYDFATIADGKLKITALPDATTKVQLVATIKSGEATDTLAFEVTVASATIEIINFAKATELSGTTKDVYTADKYYIMGTIKEVKSATYGNMVLVDDKGNEFTVYGSYDAKGEKRYDAMENAPVVGDVVVVYGVLGYYNAPQMKNGWIVASYDVKTFAEATDLSGTEKDVYTSEKYYLVGTIKEIKSATYGNMVLVDDKGNEFTVYGSYDATGANRYDAMENAPEAGDVVVVYGVLGYYNAPQMKNGWIVLSAPAGAGGDTGADTPVTPSADKSATYNFATSSTKKGTALDGSSALTLFKASTTNTDLVSVAVTKIYDGNGTGGAWENQSGFIKSGKRDVAGQLVLTFVEGKEVAKVEIKCHDFYSKNSANPTNTNTISVNGSAATLVPYTETATPGVLTFDLTTASNVVTIDITNRAVIFEIIVTFAE